MDLGCTPTMEEWCRISSSRHYLGATSPSMVIDLTGSRSRIDHRPLPPDDPRQRRPDISKARELMAWSPPTPLKEGLQRTIAYFEQLLSDRALRAVLTNSAPAGP